MNYCKIKPSIVNQFMNSCFDKNVRIRSFIIYYQNEVVADVSIPPYQSTDVQQVYSISKSFTSTACGLLYDQGLLDLEEKVIDLFPDVMVENPSKYLSNLCIKHLLSMNTGHSTDTASTILSSTNPIQTFLNLDIEYKPGTHFVYNSGASYMLSAIVQQKTKTRLVDFLAKYLFPYLDIHDYQWGSDHTGTNFGGFDLHISNQDVNKLGQLYLNNGVFRGKRIISDVWVNLASKLWSDTSIYDYSFDWKSGYGLHFWMNGTNGYRADGAYGQICLIEPGHNVVFSMLSESNNMQDELTCMQELINQIELTKPHQELKLNYYPSIGCDCRKRESVNESYELEHNRWKFKTFKITLNNELLLLEWEYDGGVFQVNSAINAWTMNRSTGPRLIRKLFLKDDIVIEPQSFYSSFEYTDQHLFVIIRYTTIPHTHKLMIRREDGLLDAEWFSSFNFYGNDKTHIRGKLYGKSK